MGVSRRELFKAGLAFGAAALVPGSLEAALTRRPPTGTDRFSRGAFEGQRNRLFRVEGESGAVLRLVDVRDPLGARKPSAKMFSVVFRGPRSRRLEQGTYTVRNARLGTFELFLVPVDRPGATLAYEAAYNLI